MLKFQKNDQIKITAGKDKGKAGKIDAVLGNGVIVGGLNLATRHQKSAGEGKPGGRIQIPKPIGFGKIALICPKCSKPTRISFLSEKGAAKVRICRKCKAKI